MEKLGFSLCETFHLLLIWLIRSPTNISAFVCEDRHLRSNSGDCWTLAGIQSQNFTKLPKSPEKLPLIRYDLLQGALLLGARDPSRWNDSSGEFSPSPPPPEPSRYIILSMVRNTRTKPLTTPSPLFSPRQDLGSMFLGQSLSTLSQLWSTR